MADSTYLCKLGKLGRRSRVIPRTQTQGANLSRVFGSDSLTTRVCYNLAMNRRWGDETPQADEKTRYRDGSKIIKFETDLG